VRCHFEIDVDEPHELLERNSAPNPQEMLMTALNACITAATSRGPPSRASPRRAVIKTSPNYFNVAQPIRIDAKLEVE